MAEMKLRNARTGASPRQLAFSPATLAVQNVRRCPDCAGPIVRGEGCSLCPICGYSRCG
ncbi:MAG: hypothetical protein WEB00_01945 [Dehalococcoidia bacterium]